MELQPASSWVDFVWFKGRINKHSICLWMEILDGLKTRDLLTKFITISNASCFLCSSSRETSNHLFLQCDYSMRIWRGIARKFGTILNSSSTIVDFDYCDISRPRNLVLAKLCFLAFVWHVWKARDARIFEGKRKPCGAVLRAITL